MNENSRAAGVSDAATPREHAEGRNFITFDWSNGGKTNRTITGKTIQQQIERVERTIYVTGNKVVDVGLLDREGEEVVTYQWIDCPDPVDYTYWQCAFQRFHLAVGFLFQEHDIQEPFFVEHYNGDWKAPLFAYIENRDAQARRWERTQATNAE